MQKVLMALFFIMHIVFITGYFINSGIIFFTTYFWLIFCCLTFTIGLHYHFTKTHMKERDLTYRVLAVALIVISIVSFCFILYVTFINPFLYMNYHD